MILTSNMTEECANALKTELRTFPGWVFTVQPQPNSLAGLFHLEGEGKKNDVIEREYLYGICYGWKAAWRAAGKV